MDDSKRKWYLPDEEIHGAPPEEAQPFQGDPRPLEALWYLPKSERGSQPQDSKPVKPKYHEFEHFEKGQAPKKPQRHDRKTQLPHSAAEHGD